MTYEGVIARRLLSVIARRRSRRSNLEDRRAELAMILEEIAALHCVPLAMTYKGVVARRLPLLSLRGGGADEAISYPSVIARRRSRRSNLISICHCEEASFLSLRGGGADEAISDLTTFHIPIIDI